MQIKDIETLQDGVSGLSFSGKAVVVMSPKEHTGQYGAFTTQFIVLEDASGSVGVKLYANTIPVEAKGSLIKVSQAKTSSYKNKDNELVKQIEVPSKGKIQIAEYTDEPEVTTETSTPTTSTLPKAKQTYAESILETLEEVHGVLTSEVAKGLLESAKQSGWNSEDIRAFTISRLIEKSRR